jgi:predicted aspartyl protease
MAWFATAMAALIAGSGVTALALAETDPPEIEVLMLEDDRYQRMTVPVTIGDQGPFRFMLDTGAQATVLSRALADQLQLFDRERALLVGMASSRSVETTSIPEFGLGSRRFVIHTAPLVDGAHIGGADGILGIDSLQDQRVLLDFANRQILVADAEELGGNRGFEIVVSARRRLGQLIITEARLDGVRVAVVIDTGAQGSIGNLALYDRLRRTRSLDATELTDINGERMSGPVRIARDLTVGRASIRNVPIMFADSPPFHGLDLANEPALILGMSELRLFRRVAIDFRTRQILFDLPRDAVDMRSVFTQRLGA